MKNNETIKIIAQAFYGNRTQTEIDKSNVDRFILGYLDNSISIDRKIDRAIVRIPDTENLVIVYNKHEEEQRRDEKRRYFESDGYELKPLTTINQLDLEIYSRCIVCRINGQGELESLRNDDYELFMDYLSE